jgi:diguanylate cyclase (GGDEF)-like protein
MNPPPTPSLERALQQALLADVDGGFAQRACDALCGAEGVVAAACFLIDEHDNLMLAAHAGSFPFGALLNGTQHLELVSTRPAFPGLAAAQSGAPAQLAAADAGDDAELAQALRDSGAVQVLGLPLPDAPQRGALCLLLATPLNEAPNATAALAALGLRVQALRADNARLRERLAQLALTDAVTGAANRRQAELVLVREIERSGRYGTPLSVMLFSLDGFAPFATEHGSEAGERLLKDIAQATQAKLRDADLLARWDDERFLVIAPHADAAGAATLADKLRDTVARVALPDGARIEALLEGAQLQPGESLQALLARVSA